jgi:outer membrane receptor protein involved in Fe transport
MEEQIIVTGSRVRRKDLTTPAPVTVLTREQWQESGKLTIGDFLQSMPEQGNAPNFQLNNGGATYGADGSTRINLRSLGVTRTLVLVNGRRVVPAGLGASSAVDVNSIPTSAVERIEVLKDGASAIYGSDAIAGVVNIITRKTLNGTELAAQYGLTDKGDAQTFDAAVTTGRSGDFGNFIFTAGYFNQRESWLRDRDFSKFALTYDYTLQEAQPGGSSRTPAGVVGIPQMPDGSPVPECTTAATLCGRIVLANPNGDWRKRFVRDPTVPLGWRLFTGNDTYNFAAENYLSIPSERVQMFAGGDTRFGPARGYFEASYVQRHSQQNAAPMPLNPGDYSVSMSKDSIYNPFGVVPTFAGRRLVEFGRRTYTQDLDTFRIVTGVDGTLPDQFGPVSGWYWDGSINYGRTSGTFTTGGAIRNSKIADAVGPSMLRTPGDPASAVCVRTPGDLSTIIPGCVPLNLFGGPNNGSISPSQIAGLGFTGTSRAYDTMFTADANVTGELFSIASDRPVSLALGYEFRRQAGAQIADPIVASGDSADFNFTSTSGYFTANEAYAELSLPLLANAPFVKDLEASVAGRYVNYSTFGGKFTYKFGARYTPIPDLTVRGTYSTAFRAPSISELYLGQAETAPTVRDPCNFDPATVDPVLRAQCVAKGVPAGGSGDVGNQELAHVGGTSNLKAETARIFTAGLVFQPQAVRNLSVTLDYYHTNVDDPVGTIGLAAILNGCFPGAGGTSYQPFCDLITRNSSGGILFVNDFNTNLRQIRTAGVDLAARYVLPTPAGRFLFAFDGTWLAYYDRDQDHAPTIHAKGAYDPTVGALPAIRFNTGVNWSFAGLAAGVLGRYVGTFKECSAFDWDALDYLSVGGLCWLNPNAPSRQVGHNWVVNMNVGYTLSSPAGKTSIGIGVNNVLDQAPQFVYAAPLANSDPNTYDFVGRFVYGRVQHTF